MEWLKDPYMSRETGAMKALELTKGNDVEIREGTCMVREESWMTRGENVTNR